LFCVPVERAGDAHGFAAGFGKRLALLHRHNAADLGGSFANERCGLLQNTRALFDGRVAPHWKAAFGGFQRAIEIVDRGVRDEAQRLFVRRLMTGSFSRSSAPIQDRHR